MRRLILCTLLLTACVGDRPRPDPAEIEDDADLVAYVRSPFNNATVPGARPLKVEIQATDVSRDALAGLGYVIRRNGARLDSVRISFPETTDTTVDFTFQVPDYPTNTQLDIYGLAFGAHGESQISLPARVIVVKCQPDLPGC